MPVVAASAVAAATLLIVNRTNPAVVPPPQAAVVHGTRVENVDFGSNTGTVFEIENGGVAVAVVWITEDDEESP